MSEREADRDSVSGEFVSEEYARAHPDTTEHEHFGEQPGEQEVQRDSRTGRFVSEQEAADDPEHTETDHV